MTTHLLPMRLTVKRAALVSLAALLFAIGWLAGILVRGVLWAATAVAVGFRDARGAG